MMSFPDDGVGLDVEGCKQVRRSVAQTAVCMPFQLP